MTTTSPTPLPTLLITLLIIAVTTMGEERCPGDHQDPLRLFVEADVVFNGRVTEKRQLEDKQEFLVGVVEFYKHLDAETSTARELKFVAQSPCFSDFEAGMTYIFFLQRTPGIGFYSIGYKGNFGFADIRKFKNHCNFNPTCPANRCIFKTPKNCEWSEFDKDPSKDTIEATNPPTNEHPSLPNNNHHNKNDSHHHHHHQNYNNNNNQIPHSNNNQDNTNNNSNNNPHTSSEIPKDETNPNKDKENNKLPEETTEQKEKSDSNSSNADESINEDKTHIITDESDSENTDLEPKPFHAGQNVSYTTTSDRNHSSTLSSSSSHFILSCLLALCIGLRLI